MSDSRFFLADRYEGPWYMGLRHGGHTVRSAQLTKTPRAQLTKAPPPPPPQPRVCCRQPAFLRRLGWCGWQRPLLSHTAHVHAR
jgi:hypothetical protein